jgi:hypothetical protein
MSVTVMATEDGKHVYNFQDDAEFVRQALASFLDRMGLPAYLQFHELLPADQRKVLSEAQQLKREAAR